MYNSRGLLIIIIINVVIVVVAFFTSVYGRRCFKASTKNTFGMECVFGLDGAIFSPNEKKNKKEFKLINAIVVNLFTSFSIFTPKFALIPVVRSTYNNNTFTTQNSRKCA